METEKKIEAVWLYFTQSTEGYRVGYQEITAIKPAEKQGEMATIIYYQIFKNGEHYADMHHFSEVIYEQSLEAKEKTR